MPKYPAISEPQTSLPSLHNTVLELKQVVEILDGARKPKTAHAVVWQDLIDLGVVDADDNLLLTSGGNGGDSGAALTKTDDTNVTLTLGGSASTALVNAASLTVGWSGQLAVGRGGTGAGSFSSGAVLKGNGTGAIVASGVLIDGSNNVSGVAKLTIAPSSGLNDGLDITQTWSGTMSGSAFVVGNNTITIADSADDNDQQVAGLLVSQNFGGSGVGYPRSAVWGESTVTSNIDGSTGLSAAVGVTGFGVAEANAGGTSGSEKGAIYGLNGVGKLNSSSASHMLHVTGCEFDVGIITGASAKHKCGLNISLLGDDAVRGSTTDAAIWVQNQGGSTLGFTNGILFSNDSSVACIQSGGAFIATRGTFTVDTGLSFPNITFSSYVLNTPHFQITGDGTIQTGASSAMSAFDANAGVELGAVDGSTGTPHIDFHSSGNNIDYDSRIIASGGTSSSGNGAIDFVASDLTVNSASVYRAGGTDVPLTDGGTGASTASAARTNLGLAIGSNVQAWDADLDSLAAISATGVIPYRSASNTWGSVTVGSGLSFSGGTLSASTPVTAQATPTSPTGSNTTAHMMGLAGSITPNKSGKIFVAISGVLNNSTAADGGTVQIRFGTGTAPSNGATATGTAAGAAISYGQNATSQKFPFCCTAVITGLTLNTAVWLDVTVQAVTGGTCSITSVGISAFEI